MPISPKEIGGRAALLLGLLVCAIYGAHAQVANPGRAAPDPTLTIQVTVANVRGRHISGLNVGDFFVSASGEQLEVVSFRQDDPVSVGVLLDLSGGLSRLYVRPAGGGASPAELLLSRFSRDGNPANQYSVIAFNKQTRVMAEAVVGAGALTDALNGFGSLKLEGPTALFDACRDGVEVLRGSKHQRRALLLVTDGEESGSRLDRKQLVRLLREGDTTLHVVALLPDTRIDYGGIILSGPPRGERQVMTIPSPETNRLHTKVDTLSELASVTGGRAYFPQSAAELADVFGRVALELRSQYLLGVAPTAAAGKGGWVKLKVKVKTPKGVSAPATVRSREGFFFR